MTVTISKQFFDWDGVKVSAGSFAGEIVRRGYSKSQKNWFWNIISEGAVKAVTLGHPPHTSIDLRGKI